MSFGARARAALDAYGPVCVGIDPHASLLEEWGLGDDIAGLEQFAASCVEAFAGKVGFVKPQSAFFERFGSAGIRVLEDTIAGLRHTGTLVILDVKRGDIGSTAASSCSR
jgi:orotidine-5'-phosphate decarboxylase